MKYLAACAHMIIISNITAMNLTEATIGKTSSPSYQSLDLQTTTLSPLVPKSQSYSFYSTSPIYDTRDMELSADNLTQFMNTNQTKLTRRTICFANVLVNVIYSYICLYLLKGYDEQNETLSRNDILDNFSSYRTKAIRECLLLYGELIKPLKFLKDSQITEENYEEIFRSWSKKTTNLVERSPVSSTTPLLEQVKNLFYRVKPINTEKTVKFGL